jgi:hypothetical protein
MPNNNCDARLGHHEQSYVIQYRHMNRELIQLQLPVSTVRETLRTIVSTARKIAASILMACCENCDTKVDIFVISEAKSAEPSVQFEVWHLARRVAVSDQHSSYSNPLSSPASPLVTTERMGNLIVPISVLDRHLRCPDVQVTTTTTQPGGETKRDERKRLRESRRPPATPRPTPLPAIQEDEESGSES